MMRPRSWTNWRLFARSFTLVSRENRTLSIGAEQQIFNFGSFLQISRAGVVAAPVFSYDPLLVYNDSIIVKLTTATTNATIYYTTDGSTPSDGSEEYTGPILVSAEGKTSIRALAIKKGMTQSKRVTANYVIKRREFSSSKKLLSRRTLADLHNVL
jgi:hypothetical protein